MRRGRLRKHEKRCGIHRRNLSQRARNRDQVMEQRIFANSVTPTSALNRMDVAGTEQGQKRFLAPCSALRIARERQLRPSVDLSLDRGDARVVSNRDLHCYGVERPGMALLPLAT